jgi:shikimate kinase
MIDKFILIGLPGVGKSTAIQEVAAALSSTHLSGVNILIADDKIKSRIQKYHPIVEHFFQKQEQPITQMEVTYEHEPVALVINRYGESVYRDLEAKIIAGWIGSLDLGYLLDLGAKACLHPECHSALKTHGYKLILLNAEHETIISRLEQDDSWRKRANYLLAGPDGWRDLAYRHRSERLDIMRGIADHIIPTDHLSPQEVRQAVLAYLGR